MNDHLSNSQWKKWMQCPAAAAAQYAGLYRPEVTDAMLIGSYIDKAITEPSRFAAWLADHADDYFKKPKKGETEREKYAFVVMADAVIARVKADPFYQRLMEVSQSQVLLEGEIGGRKWVYIADFLFRSAAGDIILYDLKSAKSFDDEWGIQEEISPDGDTFRTRRARLAWYDAMGYWRQLAIGRHLIKQTMGVDPLCVVIGATKQVGKGTRGDGSALNSSALGTWVLEDTIRMEREVNRIIRLQDDVWAWKTGERQPPTCWERRVSPCEWCRSLSTFEPAGIAVSGRMWTVDDVE